MLGAGSHNCSSRVQNEPLEPPPPSLLTLELPLSLLELLELPLSKPLLLWLDAPLSWLWLAWLMPVSEGGGCVAGSWCGP